MILKARVTRKGKIVKVGTKAEMKDASLEVELYRDSRGNRVFIWFYAFEKLLAAVDECGHYVEYPLNSLTRMVSAEKAARFLIEYVSNGYCVAWLQRCRSYNKCKALAEVCELPLSKAVAKVKRGAKISYVKYGIDEDVVEAILDRIPAAFRRARRTGYSMYKNVLITSTPTRGTAIDVYMDLVFLYDYGMYSLRIAPNYVTIFPGIAKALATGLVEYVRKDGWLKTDYIASGSSEESIMQWLRERNVPDSVARILASEYSKSNPDVSRVLYALTIDTSPLLRFLNDNSSLIFGVA